ncbi:recombinase family protein [Klebsiella pneumoniae subsp. pneumoniae]|nr:recombinase family protein [Klebsiella pneumoniae subsp. pneumoniae]
MALLGYARVSTSHQKLTVQITELKSIGVRDDRIFTDMMSGATDDRAGLQQLLARAEKDDIIICTKMDRLGRNTADMRFCRINGKGAAEVALTVFQAANR